MLWYQVFSAKLYFKLYILLRLLRVTLIIIHPFVSVVPSYSQHNTKTHSQSHCVQQPMNGSLISHYGLMNC